MRGKKPWKYYMEKGKYNGQERIETEEDKKKKEQKTLEDYDG